MIKPQVLVPLIQHRLKAKGRKVRDEDREDGKGTGTSRNQSKSGLIDADQRSRRPELLMGLIAMSL